MGNHRVPTERIAERRYRAAYLYYSGETSPAAIFKALSSKGYYNNYSNPYQACIHDLKVIKNQTQEVYEKASKEEAKAELIRRKETMYRDARQENDVELANQIAEEISALKGAEFVYKHEGGGNGVNINMTQQQLADQRKETEAIREELERMSPERRIALYRAWGGDVDELDPGNGDPRDGSD